MSDIKKFFERDSCRGTITSAELLAFKRGCTPEEYDVLVVAARVENEKILHAMG